MNSYKFKLFSRAYPKIDWRAEGKENSGYDRIIFAVGKWKLIGNIN